MHRYRDRVLLKLVSVCPVYCRFCFRRETVGKNGALDRAALEAALDYIAARPEIFEVILTGGDPLAASPRRRARVEQNERQFVGAVNLRLARMAGGINGLFDDSLNLVNLSAAVFSNATGDRALTERLASELFAARPNRRIYGLGPFFARGGFGVPGEYYSLYERRWDPRLGLGPLDRRLPDGTVEVENANNVSKANYDYALALVFGGNAGARPARDYRAVR